MVIRINMFTLKTVQLNHVTFYAQNHSFSFFLFFLGDLKQDWPRRPAYPEVDQILNISFTTKEGSSCNPLLGNNCLPFGIYHS